jgi:hypothetical protein
MLDIMQLESYYYPSTFLMQRSGRYAYDITQGAPGCFVWVPCVSRWLILWCTLGKWVFVKDRGLNWLRIHVISDGRVHVKDVERSRSAARLFPNKLLPECARTCKISHWYFHPFSFTCYTESNQCGHANGVCHPPTATWNFFDHLSSVPLLI